MKSDVKRLLMMTYVIFIIIAFIILFALYSHTYILKDYSSSRLKVWAYNIGENKDFYYPFLFHDKENIKIIVACWNKTHLEFFVFYPNGTLSKNFIVRVNGYALYTVADANDDGIDDVIIHKKNELIVIYGDSLQMKRIDVPISEPFAPPLVEDLNGDSYPDFMLISRNQLLLVDIYHNTCISFKLKNPHYPTACDINDDGKKEILILEEDGTIICLDSSLHVLWRTSVEFNSNNASLDWYLEDHVSINAVSYTHLTLPTN